MKNADKPAYPTEADLRFDKGVTELIESRGGTPFFYGLTKREYFAAMAMQSVIPTYMNMSVPLDDVNLPCRLAAQWAIKFSDELLKQLES